MAKNGRNSCTGNSRHINIRYFFVKDRVDKEECVIEYCPTEQMLADFFTKPLHGALFRILRDVIMGFKDVEDLINFAFEERVEKDDLKSCTNENDKSDKVVTYADVTKRAKKVTFKEDVAKSNGTELVSLKSSKTTKNKTKQQKAEVNNNTLN